MRRVIFSLKMRIGVGCGGIVFGLGIWLVFLWCGRRGGNCRFHFYGDLRLYLLSIVDRFFVARDFAAHSVWFFCVFVYLCKNIT